MPPEGLEAATVFLSYSREDQKRALPVIKALEAAGLQVWWDGLLEGGDNFLPTTERALETADAVVVLWSKTSVESHWVRDEATRGRERNCLVPLTLDGTHPPLGFRQFQTINISKWRGKANDPDIERAVRAVHSFADGPHVAPSPASHEPRLSRRAAIAGGTVLALAGTALAWRELRPDSAQAAISKVAVQPFENQSGDDDDTYFGQGIAEQIRLALSRNARLLVMAPASILAVAKEAKSDDPKALAEALGVNYVLTGTVRRSGALLRITAVLVEAATGARRWNQAFDKKIDDVFAVQESIAQAVADVMAAQTLWASKPDYKGPGGTSNAKAYDAYLRGNAYYELRSGEGTYRTALTQYDNAIAADPDFAAAHAARARVIVVITNAFGKANEFKSAYDDALASARKAAELAPDLAGAHSTLGFVLVQGKLDIRGAASAYQKARQMGEGDADVLSLCSSFFAQTGRAEEAETGISRALKLDPLNPGTHRMASYVAYCARDWDTAIARSSKALSLNPQIDQCNAFIGDSYLQKADFAKAKSHYALEPQSLTRLTGLAIAAFRMGDIAGSTTATDAMIAEFGDAAAYQQAQILAQSKQPDAAMAKLLLAREIGDVGLALAFTDPMLDPLKGRPDFSRLLSELGFG